MNRIALIAALTALIGLSACEIPLDRDTPATMGRELASVYDDCEDCSRRVMADGTIWEIKE